MQAESIVFPESLRILASTGFTRRFLFHFKKQKKIDNRLLKDSAMN